MRRIVFIIYTFILILPVFIHAEDYYWVGGSGKWSDLNHWRTSDNQIPNEVPDAADNVIFNENSFTGFRDTVYVLTGNPTCKDMTWINLTDTAVLYGGGNAISFDIFGSVRMDPKLRNRYWGKMTFLSNQPGNTITSNGTNFYGDLDFEGSGEWILQDTLIVCDTSDWRYVFFGSIGYSGFWMIKHGNGRLDLNGQGLISGSFITGGDNPCEFDAENATVYLLNTWTLNGQNLSFNGTNSDIHVGFAMYNLNGAVVNYNNVEVFQNSGIIQNTAIHTVFHNIHFLGKGTLAGSKGFGTEGIFTIDTLLFSGGHIGFNSSSLAQISGDDFTIHYTRIDTLIARFEVNNGYFHRIDVKGWYQGNLFEGTPDVFKGTGNTVDTLKIYRTPCKLSGQNTITGLLWFAKASSVSSKGQNKNIVHHAVFGSNGYFEGNNDFDRLTLQTGCTYRFRADSLAQPGSYHTDTYVQTIAQLEVSGSCAQGVTLFNSSCRPVQAVINYTGGPLTTDYLQVRDIRNIGTTMTVNNGIDAGNNTGIVFNNQLQPRTLYWVNGQGVWSDTGHWSLNSGGPGGECPPTRLDDVFFDSGSGFDADQDTVLVQSPNIHCNNMTWVDGFTDIVHFASADTAFIWQYNDSTYSWWLDTVMQSSDTCTLHIFGSLELDPQLSYGFWGDVSFESENDNNYEMIDLLWFGQRYELKNKIIFDGPGGKWALKPGTKLFNPNDSVIFRQGDLRFANDTVQVYNFIATDTLPRKLTFSGKTLFVVRQWGADAWNVDASKGANGNTLFEFDAGESTLRSMGDLAKQGSQKGQCNILTSGGPVTYHNIEFGFDQSTQGAFSALKSISNCTYNKVDFYYRSCYASGNGTIDTLTWHPTAINSFMIDDYDANFVLGYAENNAIYGTQQIDTALFYENAIISGIHNIGYLQADKMLSLDSLNIIDTALLLGNTEIMGKNRFSQLILGPNRRFIFENGENSLKDTTIITDDFIVDGNCDGPIRLQSDIAGKQARILYKAQNPSNPDHTADYVSIQDIAMIPWAGNQYLATNAVDLGNNENWTFDETGNETFYWVNGKGNWSEWWHWSHTSGGPPIADHCIPRESNSVVFDDQSFTDYYDTVNVDLNTIYCKNMWWNFDTAQFNPTFLGSDSSSFYIYGSLMLEYAMYYQYGGEIFFDRLNEPAGTPDTIYSRNNTFLNDVWFRRPGDAIILADNMHLSAPQRCILHHLDGDFLLNDYSLSTGGFYANTSSNRIIDMEHSTVTVSYNGNRALWLEGKNLELHAGHSTLINESSGGSISIFNGDAFTFMDVIINGGGDSLYNENNSVAYRYVEVNGQASLVTGLFTADSVMLNGKSSSICKYGTTKVVVINGDKGTVSDFQQIDRCYVNSPGRINGNNHIDYCVFFDDGTFLGQNSFDTLVLYPGQGNSGGLGNWFYFQIDSTQTVNDSLYIRGNQCSNMNLSTLPLNSPVPAYIKKENGFDIAADYLNIYNVGAIGGGNVTFYAGANSTPLPDPTNPPPGWIFENAQGYIPGFNGGTQHFCTGDTCVIDASSFNGEPSTQYFWDGMPGGVQYPVIDPGTYHIKVVYNEGCEVNDFIIIEEDTPPEAAIQNGPFCEGEPIGVDVTPDTAVYSFSWFNQDTTAFLPAQLDFPDTLSVVVTDTKTGCSASSVKTVQVKPVPHPETALGDDVTLKFGESITLDAGEGDYYEWSSDPPVSISDPNNRVITVPGYLDPVEYMVYVEIDGCSAEGYKTVSMYPPSKLGIPTAFSPNGDGVNDVLKVLGSGFAELDFRIFNRFGELVFGTNDAAIGWDGTYKGIKQPVEVYTYWIRVVFADKTAVEQSGNISLLR